MADKLQIELLLGILRCLSDTKIIGKENIRNHQKKMTISMVHWMWNCLPSEEHFLHLESLFQSFVKSIVNTPPKTPE